MDPATFCLDLKLDSALGKFRIAEARERPKAYITNAVDYARQAL